MVAGCAPCCVQPLTTTSCPRPEYFHVPLQELLSQLAQQRAQTATAMKQMEAEQAEKARLGEKLTAEREKSAQMATELENATASIAEVQEQVGHLLFAHLVCFYNCMRKQPTCHQV